MAKSKKLKLTKFKKLNLIKVQNFAKTNFFETNFLTFKAKKTFIYLQNTFTKVLIFYHFDLKYHICIKINTSKYVIDKFLSQITLNQLFFNYITHKNYFEFLNSEISQYYLIVLFFKKIILAEI